MEQSQNQLTYKELDGAEPGSRDLITFDFISEQPDILVESWDTSTNSWGESEPTAVQGDEGFSKGGSGFKNGKPVEERNNTVESAGVVKLWGPGEGFPAEAFGERAVSEQTVEYQQSQGLILYNLQDVVGGWKLLQDDGGWMKYDEQSYKYVNDDGNDPGAEHKHQHEQNEAGANVYPDKVSLGSRVKGEAAGGLICAGDDARYCPVTPSYGLEA